MHHSCAADCDGIPLLVTFANYFDTSDFRKNTQSFERNVLDFFFADKSVQFSGVVRRRMFPDNFLCWLRIIKEVKTGYREFHERCLVIPDRDCESRAEFRSEKFCQQLQTILSSKFIWKLEFQNNTGVSAYFKIQNGRNLSTEFLEQQFQSLGAVLQARGLRFTEAARAD